MEKLQQVLHVFHQHARPGVDCKSGGAYRIPMPSGPILLIILVIWAAVLLPVVIRTYEKTAPARTTRRFTQIRGSLGTARSLRAPVDVLLVRRPTPVIGAILDPAVDAHLEGDNSLLVADTVSGTSQLRPQHRQLTPAELSGTAGPTRLSARTLMRRRRTVTLLTLATLLIAAGSVAGLIPVTLLLLPMMALSGFLSACAWQARNSRAEIRYAKQRIWARRALARELSTPYAPVTAATRVETESLHQPTVATADQRYLELDAALAATYVDVEQQLGLDQVAQGHGGHGPTSRRVPASRRRIRRGDRISVSA